MLITTQKKTSHRITATFAALLAALIALAGCTSAVPEATPSPDAESSMLADHGLAGLDARQIIDRLDTMALAERPTNLIASVRPDHLLLSDDQQREMNLPIPSDQFYLSFAPYLTQTHDCHFHSLTTCVGELQNADIRVKVSDSSGATIVDEALRTFDNGFLGLWLPRGIDATLAVEHEGGSVVLPITTEGDQAATCLTTLQLT